MRKKTLGLIVLVIIVFLVQYLYFNKDYFIYGIGKSEEQLSIVNELTHDLQKTSNGYLSTSNDSWIEIKNIDKRISEIKLDLTYENSGGTLQVFYTGSKSNGYSEDNSFKQDSISGQNTYTINIDDKVESLRLDFTNLPDDHFSINEIMLVPPKLVSINLEKLIIRTLLITIFVLLIYIFYRYLNEVIKYRYILGLVLFVILVLFKINGSSIGMWDIYVPGDHESSKILGVERGIRSDEWLVQTPYLLSQAQHAELFEYKNEMIRSNGQNMVLANAPTFTLETLGKPFLWGFLLFGTDYGLSWFWFSKLILLILLSFEICMYLTKGNKGISVIGAFWIAFSAPVQWWYSTSFVESIIYSQAIIVATIYFLKSKSQKVRIGLIFLAAFSSIGFIFSIYPATQVPLGFLTLVFLAAIIFSTDVKKIRISRSEWFAFGGAIVLVMLTLALFIINSKEDINILLNTAYPGSRISTGGGGSFANLQLYLISWLLPYKEVTFSNNSEVSSFLNFLPAIVLTSVLWLRKSLSHNKIAVFLFVYLLFQLSWLFVSYPEAIAKITMYSFVPENRLMQFTFGLTALYLTIWFIAEVIREKPYSRAQTVIICFFVFILYYMSVFRSEMAQYLAEFSYITIIFFVILNFFVLRGMKKMLIVGIGSFLIISGITVNPVVKGTGAIFDKNIANKIIEINNNENFPKWIALDSLVNGQYLIALGSNSLNSVHFYPDLSVWDKLDPMKKYNDIYNRYAHIMVHLSDAPTAFELKSPDVVVVDLDIDDLYKVEAKYVLSPNELADFKNLKQYYYDSISHLYIYKVEGEQ
ncbi:DUF7657 domain-containing protein [Paenibacillus terrigena]|uniref:DUF7657 domain-containing protein n=1 Tax=Paenibacillus terrigena TaxID=369333 RepID=UPI000362CD93|nr:hypothetical protein [Paenibacillus terrigena]